MPLTATPGQETAAPTRRPHLGALSTCTLRHASDEGLVALTRAGSERAFAEIMRRYQRPLQFYCLHLVGAPRAEDAVQQAFMQAFISLRDGARREIALRPWLYRIARNCAIDLLRKQPFDHDELDPDFDGMPQTPGVFEQKEELARIVAAIQALPEGQRRALTLRELEGRSYGEISAELGHTDSGVRQLIFRARTALRNLGALILPLHSFRWRLLGSSSSSAVADPHQVAAAATVSSTGGGTALQAAASAVAATVTLLGSGVPAERHAAHAGARPTAARVALPYLRTATVPLGGTVMLTRAHRGPHHARVKASSDVAAPPAAMDPALVPAPVALTTPVPPPVEAAPSPTADPAPRLAIADQPGPQPAVTSAVTVLAPASAGSTSAERTVATGIASGVIPNGLSQPDTPPKAPAPASKPVVTPVKTKPPTKVAAPSAPKQPAAPKVAVPIPAVPKKPATPKTPASPAKASTAGA